MSWTLGGTEIKAPQSKNITKAVQEVMHRTIGGGFGKDIVGEEKLIIECEWKTIAEVDFNAIIAKYNDQRDNASNINLTVNESGFSFNANVLISVPGYSFNLPHHYNYRTLKVIFREV